jgi:hypothetical protein
MFENIKIYKNTKLIINHSMIIFTDIWSEQLNFNPLKIINF